METNSFNKFKWAKFILGLAAIYNLLWGAIISLFPELLTFHQESSSLLIIMIRCVAMLVGVYGIAYYIAALHPQKYIGLVIVGLIGKILGPLGAVFYILKGDLPPQFLWVNLTNDLIWLYPFSWITYHVYNQTLLPKSPTSVSKSLYQQWLGNTYDQLSPNLHFFHRSKEKITVKGFFRVDEGNTHITKTMAKIADLPTPTPKGEAELIVTPSPLEEIWSRRIDNKKVISHQWLENEFLVERFYVITLYLVGEVQAGNLIIRESAAHILGIPMPPFFTPTVYATGEDKDGGVLVMVDIDFKPFGRIIRYEGVVKVES